MNWETLPNDKDTNFIDLLNFPFKELEIIMMAQFSFLEHLRITDSWC